MTVLERLRQPEDKVKPPTQPSLEERLVRGDPTSWERPRDREFAREEAIQRELKLPSTLSHGFDCDSVDEDGDDAGRHSEDERDGPNSRSQRPIPSKADKLARLKSQLTLISYAHPGAPRTGPDVAIKQCRAQMQHGNLALEQLSFSELRTIVFQADIRRESFKETTLHQIFLDCVDRVRSSPPGEPMAELRLLARNPHIQNAVRSAEVRALLQRYDSDGDGKLTLQQLETCVLKGGQLQRLVTDSDKLRIGNLDWKHASEEGIRQAFSERRLGPVLDVDIPRDKMQQGVAFVTFGDHETAEQAAIHMNRETLFGRQVNTSVEQYYKVVTRVCVPRDSPIHLSRDCLLAEWHCCCAEGTSFYI